MSALPRLFLSYAVEGDSDQYSAMLYHALVGAGHDVWWDQRKMPSRGPTFMQEIAQAIDSCDRLLLIFTPRAARSEYVRAEWQYALMASKVVTVLLRDGTIADLPSELRPLHAQPAGRDRDPADLISTVLRLSSEPPAPLAPVPRVPIAPPYYRPRPDAFEQLASRLRLDTADKLPLPEHERSFLVQGIPGVGKSVLVAALARSTSIRRQFETVLWVEVGPTIDEALPVLQRLASQLGENLHDYGNLAVAANALSKRLEAGGVLIVLDNVFAAGPVEAVRQALGPRCRLIVTTRMPGLIDLGVPPVALLPVSVEEAVAYLEQRTGPADGDARDLMRRVAQECGGLPFALALAGTMARGTSWQLILDRLVASDLSFMTSKFPGYPYADLLRSLHASIEHLQRHGEALQRKAVSWLLNSAALVWEAGLSEAALLHYWRAHLGVGSSEAGQGLNQLLAEGLLEAEGLAPRRTLRMHDLQQDYLWAQTADRAEAHAKVLRAWGLDRPQVPLSVDDDGYFLQHAFMHLEQSGHGDWMHEVLRLETVNGENSWWHARIASGQALGYAEDVQRARRHAVRDLPVDAVPLAQRYALMLASARSGLLEMPLVLAEPLIEVGLWKPAQAMAILEWQARGARRLDAYLAVMNHLPESERRQAIDEALQLARGQPEPPDRAGGLLRVAERLPDDARAALIDEAMALPGTDSLHFQVQAWQLLPGRGERLEHMLRALTSEDAASESLDEPHSTGGPALNLVSMDTFRRRMDLLLLAGALPTTQLPALLPHVSGAGTPEEQGEVLTVLAERSPSPIRERLAREAFDLLADGEDFRAAGVTAVKRQARLLRILPAGDRANSAESVFARLPQLKWIRDRCATLADTLVWLQGEHRSQAERELLEHTSKLSVGDVAELVNEGRRAERLANDVPETFLQWRQQLLSLVLAEGDGQRRQSALAVLLPLLDAPSRQNALSSEVLRGRRVDDLSQATAAAAALAGQLDPAERANAMESLLRQMLASTDVDARAWEALVPLADAAQLARIAPYAEALEEDRLTAAICAGHARCGEWETAFAWLQRLPTPTGHTWAFAAFPERVPVEVARGIVSAAMRTTDPEWAASDLPAMVGHFESEERDFVAGIGLQAAEVLSNRYDRYRLLQRMLPWCTAAQLDQAAALIPAGDDTLSTEREEAQAALAIQLARRGLVSRALDAMSSLRYASSSAGALTKMLPLVDSQLRPTLLKAAEARCDQECGALRVELLVALASAASAGSDKVRLTEKAYAVAQVPAERTMFESAEAARARALVAVLPLLDGPRHAQAALDAWRAASRGGTVFGEGLLARLSRELEKLDVSALRRPWLDELEAAAADRRRVLETFSAMAPIVVRMGGRRAILAAIDDIAAVQRWWP